MSMLSGMREGEALFQDLNFEPYDVLPGLRHGPGLHSNRLVTKRSHYENDRESI